MSRGKSYLQKSSAVETPQLSRPASPRRLLQLAPMSNSSAHSAHAPLHFAAQSRTNLTAEPAAAVIVPKGEPIARGSLEIVGPGGSVTAPGGSRVAGFIHSDGTAVQFLGDSGGVFLSAALAQREFGSLIPRARQMLTGSRPAAATNTLHRRAESPGSVDSTAAVDAALKSTTSHPLPPRSRNQLESSFGTDLGSVRIHTDSAADRAATSLQAKAFATGQDVYFRSGQYQPETSAGQHLLAHEVAHTVQQGSESSGISRAPETGNWNVSQPTDRHEAEAERAADAASRGHRAVISGVADAATIARRADQGKTGATTTPPTGPAGDPAGPGAGTEKSLKGVSEASSKPGQPAVTKSRQEKKAGESNAASAGAPTHPGAKHADQSSNGGRPEPKSGEQEAVHDKKTKGADKQGVDGHAPGGKKGASRSHSAGGHKEGGKAGGSRDKAGRAGAAGKKKKSDSGSGLGEVIAQVKSAGHEQQSHPSVGQASQETVKATDVTPEEAAGKARGEHVEQMAAQKKGPFNRDTFKKALRDKIAALQADDAKNIKDGDQAQGISNAVKDGVEQEKQAAAGPINQVAQQAPAKGETKPGDKLPETAPAPASQIDGSKAVPEPVPAERRSLEAETQAADQQMSAANVTTEQLQKSNEPAFTAAAAAHETAKSQADALPEKAATAEANSLESSRAQVSQAAQAGLTDMQGQRSDKLAGSKQQQEAGKAKYEAARKRISEQLGGIYEETKKSVDARMATLDIDVNLVFEAGSTAAKVKFYAYLGVELLKYYVGGSWLVDAITGGNSKEEIFQKGRDRYLADMESVIDQVADVVETGLNDVVSIIEKGRGDLEAAMKQFGPEDAAVAEEVAGGLRDKFASLEKSVEEKQTAIIDSVAQKYVEAQKDVDSVINVLRDPVGALIAMAVDAVAGVIATILKMKGLLMSALSKAGEAIDLILADPIAFLGYLVEGVKQGVLGFLGNIGTYLQKGLLDWLFGALAEAGIQMPEKFDLSGLLSVVLQVLGLTYANIRQRAVGIVGENVVKALETGSKIFIILATKGVTGIWDYIKEQATTLIQTVKEGVKSFIMDSVIMAGAKWLLGLLNPASAFVKACLAIYDIITFIINKGQQILTFVNAVIDSVLTIAKGNIAPAAKAVEAALARSIPVAIGFLASLLGIGDLGEKIKKVIDTIQEPINKVIDWLITKAVALVKAVGKALGLGKESHAEDLGPAKNAAVTRLNERIKDETTLEEVQQIVSQVLEELRPIGLKGLEISPPDENEQYSILAEASEKRRVTILSASVTDVIVSVCATITLRKDDLQVTEGMLNTNEKLQWYNLTGNRAIAARGFDPTTKSSPTSAPPVSVAALPHVDLPPGTPAKVGYQPSAGMIKKPLEGGRTIEIESWNTKNPVYSSNVSHAEYQFINWISNRPDEWMHRVEKIVLTVTGKPICDRGTGNSCAADLSTLERTLAQKYPQIQFEWPKEYIEKNEVESHGAKKPFEPKTVLRKGGRK